MYSQNKYIPLFSTKAFSLVEVVLALGVMSFALTSIIGLLPVGMKTFREAVDTSISTQIIQRLSTDAAQTDFATLVAAGAVKAYSIQYFNDQGEKVTDPAKAIYHAKVVASQPAEVPGGSSPDLARLTIDIVRNPGNKTLRVDPSTSGILSEPDKGLPVLRCFAFVARRK